MERKGKMRKQLRKSDIRELNEKLEKYKFQASKKDMVEIIGNVVFINKRPMFFYDGNNIVPTLNFIMGEATSRARDKGILAEVTVDSGAVRFIVSGADVMRPGIREFDDFEKESYVIIIEEKYKKPLAVGKALFSSEAIRQMASGKVIKNMHYVGDDIWQQYMKE